MSNFDHAFEKIIGHEGGYVNDPDDPGGETNFGITIATARKHGYVGDMIDIPLRLVKIIYKRGYWSMLNLDFVTDPRLGGFCFDTAVNMGIRVSGKILQKAINKILRMYKKNGMKSMPKKITVDGFVGNVTLHHTNIMPGDDLLHIMIDLRRKRYKWLVWRNPKLKKYIRGWLRRVNSWIPKKKSLKKAA